MMYAERHPLPPYQQTNLAAGRLVVQRLGAFTYRVRLACWCANCSRFTHFIVGRDPVGWYGLFSDLRDNCQEIHATAAEAYRDASEHLRTLQGRYCLRPLLSLRGDCNVA